jgi:hypothetical protein
MVTGERFRILLAQATLKLWSAGVNRRNFFRNLAIGVAAAPVIAKVIQAAPSPPPREIKQFPPDPALDRFSETLRKMHIEVCRQIAFTDPYAQLLADGGLSKSEIATLVENPISL